MSENIIVHGLDLSYFTGKLEAYLRAKGIPFEMREMTTRSFRACGKATGVLQMPQVELPDGTWLTDTTLIIKYFERTRPQPQLTPMDPAARFISRLVEDFGDECLWRPALYYRWAFEDDARLMSGRIAQGMLRDVNLPLFIRRQMIKRRQQLVYLRKDGVTRKNRNAVEALYLATLAAMEEALSESPYILGARPAEADFGLFGSMFRHFFSDPTPSRIMRERALRTMAWIARLWATTPSDYQSAPLIQTVPAALSPLLKLVASSHLPYLASNAMALELGNKSVQFTDHGGEFEVPVSPYRAWCLSELQREFAILNSDAKGTVCNLLGEHQVIKVLSANAAKQTFSPPELPITPRTSTSVLDRNWH